MIWQPIFDFFQHLDITTHGFYFITAGFNRNKLETNYRNGKWHKEGTTGVEQVMVERLRMVGSRQIFTTQECQVTIPSSPCIRQLLGLAPRRAIRQANGNTRWRLSRKKVGKWIRALITICRSPRPNLTWRQRESKIDALENIMVKMAWKLLQTLSLSGPNLHVSQFIGHKSYDQICFIYCINQ